MTGFRFTDEKSRGRAEGLLNGNLFYTISKDLILGLEVNYESRPNHPDISLIMPQIHLQVATHAIIQFSFGMKRSHHENFPHAAARLFLDSKCEKFPYEFIEH